MHDGHAGSFGPPAYSFPGESEDPSKSPSFPLSSRVRSANTTCPHSHCRCHSSDLPFVHFRAFNVTVFGVRMTPKDRRGVDIGTASPDGTEAGPCFAARTESNDPYPSPLSRFGAGRFLDIAAPKGERPDTNGYESHTTDDIRFVPEFEIFWVSFYPQSSDEPHELGWFLYPVAGANDVQEVRFLVMGGRVMYVFRGDDVSLSLCSSSIPHRDHSGEKVTGWR